jgi:NAD(P)-dependent dehydrogenase (short-subunit alcohol dehydrogenase family)
MSSGRVAVVTGGNRGIGFEVCRQLAQAGMKVILAARDPDKGEQAAHRLRAEGHDVDSAVCDVADESSVDGFCDHVLKRYGRVDVLINNAAIIPDGSNDWSSDDNSVFAVPRAAVRQGFESNVLGAYQLCQRLIPGMRERGWGRVVNVSSGMGALTDMGGRYPGYRLSKASLNAMTRIFARELGASSGVKVNSVGPGWVKTDMGGAGATRDLDEGARSVTWGALLDDDGPTGGFFRDGERIDW